MPPVAVALTPLAPIANKESFIERFGDWITGIFHHSETLYDTLTAEEKKAGVWASGLIAIINANLNAVPAVVITIIQQKFPDLSVDVIHGFLDEVRNKIDNLGSAIPLTLEDAIVWAQQFLGQHEGDHSAWAVITTTAVNLLATLFSPTTVVEKFINVGLYIYHLIVKPHVEGTAVPAATPTPVSAPAPAAIPAPTPTNSTTVTAQTPDQNPPAEVPPSDDNTPQENAAALQEQPDGPVQYTGTTDADMQISNEAAANLTVGSGQPIDETHDPIEEAAKANRAPTDFELRNTGASPAGVPIPAPDQPAQDEVPNGEAAIASTDETVANTAPAPLVPGTPEFEAAVNAEIAKRKGEGTI